MNDLQDDLQQIVYHTAPLWQNLRGKRIFLTGGTGFFGIWLLESFIRANADFDLQAQLVVLSRDLSAFAIKAPHLVAHSAIQWVQGDVRSFEFPAGRFDFVIHGAMTTASETFHKAQSPMDKYDLIVGGARRVLDFTLQSAAHKLLLISSGPTYGRQPTGMTHISEDYCGAPLTTDIQFDFSILGEAKRVAELMSSIYAQEYGLQVAIARCFSFVGPYLPLDLHYAIGNFIRNVLCQQPIRVSGDGTPIRTYQYISDTINWLWTLLLANVQGIYNVGSDQAYSIAELAHLVAKVADLSESVVFEKQIMPNSVTQLYVPAITKAQQELGLECRVDLTTAIAKTLQFYRNSGFNK